MKKTTKKEVKSDFIIAKEIVADFKVHQESVIKVSVVKHFRKYLTDHSKLTEKQFITRLKEGVLSVIRLK